MTSADPDELSHNTFHEDPGPGKFGASPVHRRQQSFSPSIDEAEVGQIEPEELTRVCCHDLFPTPLEFLYPHPYEFSFKLERRCVSHGLGRNSHDLGNSVLVWIQSKDFAKRG